MEEGPPEPPIRPLEETPAVPTDQGAIPPFEPLLEPPPTVQPVPEAPVGAAITASEREQWCRRAVRACTEGRLTLGAYSDLVEVLQETCVRETFEGAAAEVAAAGSSAAVVPLVSGSPMVAILSSHDRKGAVHLPQETQAVAVMGGINLDLREATISGPVTVLRGFALMGGIDIRIPPGIRVETGCIPILGGCDVRLKGPPPRQDAPVVRLELVLVMAGVNVKDGGGMKDLVQQAATLPPAGFSDPRLLLQQSRMEARIAHRAAHEARREAHRAAREVRRGPHH